MFELYSRRIKNSLGEPEIYEYNEFSIQFRNQFFFVLSDVLDYAKENVIYNVWDNIHDYFARELGVKCLYSNKYPKKAQIEFFVEQSSNDEFLDFIDYSFCAIINIRDQNNQLNPYETDFNEIVERAIIELNCRFKQHNLGYEFVNGEIIRKDNEYMHQQVVKPALKLLVDAGFIGAEQEFMDAFEHRRKGENKDAILDALKAFESTMKAICDGIGYPYDATRSTAKDLISILEQNSFYPAYLNNHITSLRTSLESGLPTLRNKNAGHGQGTTVVNVSDEFTEYALNLAATNIVLLVKIYVSKVT